MADLYSHDPNRNVGALTTDSDTAPAVFIALACSIPAPTTAEVEAEGFTLAVACTISAPTSATAATAILPEHIGGGAVLWWAPPKVASDYLPKARSLAVAGRIRGPKCSVSASLSVQASAAVALSGPSSKSRGINVFEPPGYLEALAELDEVLAMAVRRENELILSTTEAQ